MATFIEEVKRKAIEMAEEEMTHIIENATDEYRAGVDILFGLALARFIEEIQKAEDIIAYNNAINGILETEV